MDTVSGLTVVTTQEMNRNTKNLVLNKNKAIVTEELLENWKGPKMAALSSPWLARKLQKYQEKYEQASNNPCVPTQTKTLDT